MIIYIFAPIFGAVFAAVLNKYHQTASDAVEYESDQKHKNKLNDSRSQNKIDVEDTRSLQSDVDSE